MSLRGPRLPHRGSVVSVALMGTMSLQFTPAFAQTVLPPVTVTGTGFDGLQLDEPSSTASRLGFKLREVPASADVVFQRDIQDKGAQSVVQALQGTTGLTGAVRAGAPGVYSMRGFIENGIAIQYDGIRVGASTVYTRPYDTFKFERIEVLRGPASAIHGDSAVGGVINYVRRKPVSGPITFDALASVGSFSTYRLGAAASGSINRSTSFVLSAVGSDRNSFVNENSTSDLHLVGGLRFDLGSRVSLLIEADYWRASTDNAYWGTPLVSGTIDRGLRRVNYNIAPDNRYADDVFWTRAALDYPLWGGWTGRTQVYYYKANRDWRNFAAPRANAGTSPLNVTIREVEDLLYDASQPGVRQEVANNGRLWARPYRFVLGVEYNRSDFHSPRFQAGPTNIVVDAFDPGSRSFAAFAGPRNRLRAADVDTLAAFVEASYDMSSRLRLFGAYRHDDLKVRTRFQQPGAAEQRGARDYRADSARIGATYALSGATTLYGAMATGSEPVDNSGFAFISPADLSRTELTRATQYEVGTKHQFAGGRAEVTAAVYDITRERVLTADPANPSGARFQVGEQKSQGLELAGAWRPTRAVSVFGNAAWVSAEYANYVAPSGLVANGNRPRMVPRFVANAGVTVRPMPRLELTALGRHVSKNPLNDDNTVFLPSYTVGDLFARYQLTRNADVTAAVRNFTDRVYADWGIQFLGAQVANIAPPRTFELALRMRFR